MAATPALHLLELDAHEAIDANGRLLEVLRGHDLDALLTAEQAATAAALVRRAASRAMQAAAVLHARAGRP